VTDQSSRVTVSLAKWALTAYYNLHDVVTRTVHGHALRVRSLAIRQCNHLLLLLLSAVFVVNV